MSNLESQGREVTWYLLDEYPEWRNGELAWFATSENPPVKGWWDEAWEKFRNQNGEVLGFMPTHWNGERSPLGPPKADPVCDLSKFRENTITELRDKNAELSRALAVSEDVANTLQVHAANSDRQASIAREELLDLKVEMKQLKQSLYNKGVYVGSLILQIDSLKTALKTEQDITTYQIKQITNLRALRVDGSKYQTVVDELEAAKKRVSELGQLASDRLALIAWQGEKIEELKDEVRALKSSEIHLIERLAGLQQTYDHRVKWHTETIAKWDAAHTRAEAQQVLMDELKRVGQAVSDSAELLLRKYTYDMEDAKATATNVDSWNNLVSNA